MRWSVLWLVSLLGCSGVPATETELTDETRPVRRQGERLVSTVSVSELRAITPGSQVVCEIPSASSHAPNGESAGTVVAVSPSGLVLINCTSKGIAAGTAFGPPTAAPSTEPNLAEIVNRVEYSPIKWVGSYQFAHIRVTAPPPDDYVAPQLDFEAGDIANVPPVDFLNKAQVDRLVAPSAVAELARGSRIQTRLVSQQEDQPGAVFAGTVVHSSSQGVALIACVEFKPAWPAPHDAAQAADTVSNWEEPIHHSVQWLPAAEIAALQVLSPPPPEFIAPDLGIADRSSH